MARHTSDDPADQSAPIAPDDRTMRIVDTALKVQRPLASKYVASLRTRKPGASDDELVRHVEKRFHHLLTAAGAGVGGAAAMPGVGTAVAVGLTLGEGAAFAEACAFLTLAVAEIRGVDMRDPDKRRMITMGVLSGEKGAEIMAKALGKQGAQWSSVVSGVVPDFVMRTVMKRVNAWLRRRVLARVGGVWAGRLIPFGVGAVVGGLGNHALARSVVAAEREIFSSVPGAGLSATDVLGELEAGDDA